MDGKTIVDGWLEHRFSDPGKYLTFEHLALAIDAALAQARAEEREACAKIAEHTAIARCMRHQKTQSGVCGHEIAAAIRARRP